MASVEPDVAALHATKSDEKTSPARPPSATPAGNSDHLDTIDAAGNVDKKLRPKAQDIERTQQSGHSGKTDSQNAIVMSRLASLPADIIRNILLHSDPETFASATLICRSWRSASNDASLYALQLSKCQPRSSSGNTPVTAEDQADLSKLKQHFAREAKRSLFLPFIRPKITTISLISEAPLSSFAAGPGGEKFEFVFSQSARWCLAISSSRIYVIDLTGPEDVEVVKELKVLRRPLGAEILPDGSLMAVLSSDHSVSLYAIKESGVELKRMVDLDNVPYAIAMSPGGEVLAAAFDGGLELCSLREGASAMEKRSVKAHRVDKVMFSSDGSVLLGTTQGRDPATVILTAPYFSADEFELSPSELVNSMWTRQILFPASSRDCSHSALLPRHADDDSKWTLTYDRTYESFRAVRTDDLRNGTTYFTGPQAAAAAAAAASKPVVSSKDALLPTTLPSITTKGDMVAAGFKGSEIWLYGVPENLDAAPTLPTAATSTTEAEEADEFSHLPDIPWMPRTSIEEEGPPRWQMLVDKHRNVFSKGRKVADIADISSMCWFHAAAVDASSVAEEAAFERLIVAAPGGVGSDTSLEEATPIDGGRLIILDFGLQPGADQRVERSIEIGIKEPQLLEEQKTDIETEIARVRRRTMAQRESRVRSVLDALRPDNDLEDVPEVPPLPGASNAASSGTAAAATEPDGVSDDDDEGGITLEEAVALAEGPYSHANPRSRTALYRSATMNQVSRHRVEQARQPDPLPQPPMRRQDGTEVPDESDADNWVPPPPPYQRHANDLLPDSLVQRAMLYSGIAPLPSTSTAESMVRPRRSSSLNDGRDSSRRRSSVEVDILANHLRRPVRNMSEVSLSGVSTVSSVSVTPRSSVRRRPLTVYQSSSSALRDSGVRDSAMSRTTSQISRSLSIGSSNARISRSGSLRRSVSHANEAGSAAALSVSAAAAAAGASSVLDRPPSPVEETRESQESLHDRPDWPLAAPPEEPEDISPADAPSPQSVLVPEPGNELDLSPELDPLTLPEPVRDEEQLPEAVMQQPVSPEIIRRDSGIIDPQQSRWSIQRRPVPQQQQEQEPQQRQRQQQQEQEDPIVVAPMEHRLSSGPLPEVIPESVLQSSLPEAREPVQPQQQGLFPIADYQLPHSTSTQPLQEQQEAIHDQRQNLFPLSDYQISSSGPTRGPHPDTQIVSPLVSPTQPHSPPIQELHAISMPQELPLTTPTPPPTTTSPTIPPIPEPSTSQLAALETRPRPSARQLSNSRPRIPPTPLPLSTSHPPLRSELPPTPSTPKPVPSTTSISSARRFSQRLRGVLKRNDTEPVPELPQIPPLLAQHSQPPPTGPARHSRLYANTRNNASEPALRRPTAQRLDTIESVNTQFARTPVVEAAPGVGGRPQAKRRRSIFGRRKSRDVSAMQRQGEGNVNVNVPPVPALPGNVNVMGGRAREGQGQGPVVGLRRAQTDRGRGGDGGFNASYFPGGPRVDEPDEMVGGGKGGKKRKDGGGAKCIVM